MTVDTPVWQFQYSAPRGHGVQTRIRATGRAPRKAGLAGLVVLSEMLVALCDNWPVSELATDVVQTAATRSMAAEEPQILTVPWRSPVQGADRREPAHQASGIDAA